jgi:disulfide bond formation protein DsbB
MKKFSSFLTLISIVALATAYIAEYAFGYKPCILCLYERIPYAMIIGLSLISIFIPKINKITILLFLVTLFASTALSFYHIGVEQGFFNAPTACSVEQTNKALTIEQLREEIYKGKPTSCKEVTLKFLGLSMASWNLILSLILFIFSIINRKKYVQSNS